MYFVQVFLVIKIFINFMAMSMAYLMSALSGNET